MKKVRIYNPPKSAMQSGKANTKKWVLESVPTDARFVDPVMGWTGSSDMLASEIKLKFKTRQEAEEYAKNAGWEFEIIEPKQSKPRIKFYSDNFKFDCK